MTERGAEEPGSPRPATELFEAVTASPLVAPNTEDGGGDPEDRRFSVYDHIRTPPDRRSLRQLPSLVRGGVRLAWRAGRAPLVGSAVLQLLAGVAIAGQLLVARALLHDVIATERSGGSFGEVLPALLLMGSLTVLLAVAAVVQSELSALLGELMSRQASREILDVASAVDLEAYETPAFHDRLERARLNAQSRPVSAVNGLLGVLSAGFGAIGIAGALLAVQPLLVPVALLAVVPMWLSITYNSRALYRFSVEMTPLDRERTYVENVLSNKDLAKEVRAFALTRFFRDRFESLYERRLSARRQLIARRLRRSLLATVASSAIALSSVALLIWLLLSGRTTLAATGTGLLGILYLGQRLSSMMSSAGTLYESALFIDDFTLFLDLRHEVESTRPTSPAPTSFEELAVDRVTFTYPGARKPALHDVSIAIRRGEVVALVGDNGSGKTTLAKLLGLLYRPDSGRILWDGIDSATKDPEELRRSITVIFQDFGRYWLAARDNIGIGATERLADLDGIVAAARAAGADSFLTELPSGYETVLSRLFEGGRDLSIGQWQRVALARAFFRDAPLVIMDEPTAALDAMAEYRLFQSMREMCRGRAVLLISHRFSSVRGADRTYVLDQGRVIETGTHDELMALGGRYARMFSLQASAYLDPA
jgi:ATP-binding cassette subfamily B protein